MADIIKFPQATRRLLTPPEVLPIKNDRQAQPTSRSKWKALGMGLHKVVWILTVAVWPILRWIVSFDVVFQFVRMIYRWTTPGMHSGWTFVLHFALLTALTYFVQRPPKF